MWLTFFSNFLVAKMAASYNSVEGSKCYIETCQCIINHKNSNSTNINIKVESCDNSCSVCDKNNRSIPKLLCTQITFTQLICFKFVLLLTSEILSSIQIVNVLGEMHRQKFCCRVCNTWNVQQVSVVCNTRQSPTHGPDTRVGGK